MRRWEGDRPTMGEPAEADLDEGVADGGGERLSSLREGLLVGAKYRLIEEKGTGAMGSVWSATHVTLGHTVAIKFLHGSVMSSDDARARFEREARVAARLGEASRHITRVIDHGVMEADGTPYLVMELLQGENLFQCLRREKRLPLTKVARIVQQLARSLHVTHSAGVVHRDLKPSNIFLCAAEDGDDVFVKLLDFGIAKATHDSEDESTGAGTVLGTPGYMSPEQVLGDRDLDLRSDLWAVAAMVYRMTTGRPPFGRGPVAEIGVRILSNEPPPPTQLVPELPRELDMWMARGLAKKPDERFQTVKELADFLAVVAGLTTTTAITQALPTITAPSDGRLESVSGSLPAAVAPALQRRVTRPSSRPPPPRRKMMLPIVVAAVGFCAIGIGIGVAMRGGKDRPPDAPGAPAANSDTTTSGLSVPTTPTASPSPSVLVSAAPSAAASSPTPKASTSTSGKPLGGTKKKVDKAGWDNKKEL